MNYKIDNDSDNQKINVKVTCILDQEVRKKVLTEVANYLNISKYRRVLIDLSESSFKKDEPMLGALELTGHMNKIGISSQTKLAFIFSEAEDHRKYFESVANSFGFNIRYFKDKEAASKWLNE